MSAFFNSHTLTSNQILGALPREQYPDLFAGLHPVDLKRGKVMFELADPIPAAFFILSGMVSLLSTTEDGFTTEIAMVGSEGVVGVPIVLGINKAPYEIIVQIPGRAMQIGATTLVREFRRPGPFQEILLRYIHSLVCQISQSAACNRFHSLEQRLCRWLLIGLDRVDSNNLPLTQEALSHMVGASRTNVTKAATALKRAGLIQYRRGEIRVVDRQALEEKACECYRVITEELGQFRAA
jgi:CRP-like cAMP-binding protein